MNLEDQIRQHKEISLKIEELEAQKKALGQSIMQAMNSKALQLGPYLVRRFSRLSFTLTVDQARPFKAIKLEEVVDKDKLKELYRQGTSIPGAKEVEYIQISMTENESCQLRENVFQMKT